MVIKQTQPNGQTYRARVKSMDDLTKDAEGFVDCSGFGHTRCIVASVLWGL